MHPVLRTPGILLTTVLLFSCGCDQQQPIAAKPPPTPGVKDGETPPVEPEQGPQRHRDGGIPLPPATAPTTPGVPNHPSAPQVPPTPSSPATQTPPPTSSPTEAPSLVPPPRDGASLQSSDGAPVIARSGPPVNHAAGRDSSITSAVYRALSSQPGLSHDGALVTISTLNGEVTLRGSVATDAERDQLAVVAGQVAGVRSVNNQLDLIGP